MRYVQYGYLGTDGEFREALGDRAVVILDGRNSVGTSIEDGHGYNGVHRPRYDAFRIMQGRSFSDSKALTGVIAARPASHISAFTSIGGAAAR